MNSYQKWAYDVYEKVRIFRDKLLRSPAMILCKLGITANHISFSRLFLIIPIFYCVGFCPIIAFILLIVNYYVLDAIDGVIARVSGTDSKRGRTIDLSIDHFYVIPLTLALIYFNFVSPFWAAIYISLQLIEYFTVYLLYGIDSGKFPFLYEKFLVYFGFFLWVFFSVSFFDYIFVFLTIYLFVRNIFNITHLYYGK